MPDSRPENLLVRESSPYLLQHKDNPVHWRPWGQAALLEAQQNDRPILLSIGYAACHWCHVMAHESFENPDIAAVMNELFVNIKVDREERPDIDSIYMNALHSLGEQGGWPLTMFLTPQGEPFWGGTYFPPEPRYGRPGFVQLLREVSRLFKEERDKLLRNRDAILKALAAQAESIPGTLPPSVIPDVAKRLVEAADMDNGGIGGPPKFPQPFLLELMFRHGLRMQDETAFAAVKVALDHMAQGGMYDHLGGGFARYSVDEYWLVPHFEKMLYDNAQLISIYTLAWQKSSNPLYAERVRETIEWLIREMRVDDGAFAASLDADSEGEEGKFYVWQENEVDAGLNGFAPAEVALFKKTYDVSAQGNWEHKTILNRLSHVARLSDTEEDMLRSMRLQLCRLRESRIRPGFDDKVLTDWNGLVISALAEAGAVFNQPAWLEAAQKAYNAIVTVMSEGQTLAHASRHGKVSAIGLASDYACLSRAALKLYELTGQTLYLDGARAFTDELMRSFWDGERKGYFHTRHDAGDVIARLRSVNDDATASANAIMVEVHARLWLLTGDDIHRERTDDILHAFAGEVARNFVPLGTFLNGFDLVLHAVQIVIVAQGTDASVEDLRREIYAHALPTRVILQIEPDESLPKYHPAFGKPLKDGRPTVYVCVGNECSLPLNDVEPLREKLSTLFTQA